DLTSRDHRLRGDTAGRVLGQHGVQDRVADRISDLVGMTLGHRLRTEKPAAGSTHCCSCLLVLLSITGWFVRSRRLRDPIDQLRAWKMPHARFPPLPPSTQCCRPRFMLVMYSSLVLAATSASRSVSSSSTRP